MSLQPEMVNYYFRIEDWCEFTLSYNYFNLTLLQ